MTFARPALAARLLALLQSLAFASMLAMTAGCSNMVTPPPDGRAVAPAQHPPPTAATPFTLVTPQEYEQVSPTLGVQIEIDAPKELKALLERHLDLVRLGRVARDDVDDTEWSRLIDATPSQVRDLLQTEGYFSTQVQVERAPGRGANQPDLVTVKVQPGVRAHVSRVTIEVEGELERGASSKEAHASATLQQLRDGWELGEGKEFRNPTWSSAKSNALARLRAAGYANATWSGTGAEVDPERNEVRLFLVADSGPLFRYGELEIEGLVVQNADTVRNLLNAQRGAPVTEAMTLDFQERLQKSGLFENVNVTLDPDPTRADKARIIARLRESPLQVYTFGVGISANTGPRASVEHFYRRVFGLPVSSRNKVEWGQQRQFWEGEISTHPGENLYRNLLGGTVENLESSSDTVLSQRLRLGRTQDTQRIERLYFVEAERSRRVTTADQVHTNAFALSLNYHGTWRELDSVVLPTQGFTFAGEIGIGRSHGTNADAGIFQRAYGRFTGYVPFGSAWYGQARVELGKVFLGANMVVPDSQKFRAGGDESVRGYSYRSLGPIVDGAVGSGSAMYTASIEVARPILASMPSLWGAVFIDAGNAANSFAELHPAVGVGVGVRWRSPVGPLRLDYAYGREVKKARFHFSVGIAF